MWNFYRRGVFQYPFETIPIPGFGGIHQDNWYVYEPQHLSNRDKMNDLEAQMPSKPEAVVAKVPQLHPEAERKSGRGHQCSCQLQGQGESQMDRDESESDCENDTHQTGEGLNRKRKLEDGRSDIPEEQIKKLKDLRENIKPVKVSSVELDSKKAKKKKHNLNVIQ